MRNALSILLVSAGVLGLTGSAFPATNGLDATFGSHGLVALGPTPTSAIAISRLRAIAVQANGRILIGGNGFDPSDPSGLGNVPLVGRLKDDGSWDTTFGDHGAFALPYGSASAPAGGEIHEIVVLSDNSIVAAGGTYSGGVDFNTCTLLLKLTDVGALDSSFGPGQDGSYCFDFAPDTNHYLLPFHHEGLLRAADDSLYLTTPYTNLTHGAVAHLDSNGAPISGYGSNGIAALPEHVVATRVQLTADNKVLTMGGIDNAAAIAVVRLDDTGQVDNPYGSGGMIAFDAQPGGLVSPSRALLDAQQRLVIADNDENGGDMLYYRFARLTIGGALDTSFNGSSQQPGFPGLAAPPVTSGDYFDGLTAAIPLADGHILGVGDAGFAADGDGATNLALLRLSDDSSYDASFGDAAHPGWASLNIGSGVNGFTRVRVTASDVGGHAFVAIEANDGNLHGCIGIVRLIPDRLFENRFDAPPATPACPQ
jgi:uncharacterized delta-60 repeat protein